MGTIELNIFSSMMGTLISLTIAILKFEPALLIRSSAVVPELRKTKLGKHGNLQQQDITC